MWKYGKNKGRRQILNITMELEKQRQCLKCPEGFRKRSMRKCFLERGVEDTGAELE